MVTRSSILAWRIPWTEEPGGLQSMDSQKESDTTQQLNNDEQKVLITSIVRSIFSCLFVFNICLYIWLCWSQLCHAGSFVVVCQGLVVAAQGLSCPTACGILVPPPGTEPMSPALEGKFLTTGPPGKSLRSIFQGKIHTCENRIWKLIPVRLSSLMYLEKVFVTPRGIHRRRQWHPTLILLPEKSHGQRNLVGCSPWGHEESDTTE